MTATAGTCPLHETAVAPQRGGDNYRFPAIAASGTRIYPVVDSAEWVNRLVPLGVAVIQLRVKNLKSDALEQEIAEATDAARKADCMLFVNDYWELAVKHRAYGVHLGQSDLLGADLDAIRTAGLRLGVSTHCHHEAEKAAEIGPSYVAFGPVYETKLKEMPFPPQGVARLKQWRRMFDCPLVAIGGITLEQADAVMEARPDYIAVVRDITQANDPETRTQRWRKFLKE